MQRRFDCYLVGQLQGATIVALRTCGESAWGMTHTGRTPEQVDLLHSVAGSYTEAENHLRMQYERLYPVLCKILPFPQHPARPATMVATRHPR